MIAAYLFLAIACFSDHSLAQNQCTSVWQEDIRPEILNPYTLEHSLKSQLKDTSGLLTQIEARKLNLLLSQQQNPEVLSQIDTWVKSDVHALYLYDRIQSSQNEALKPTLQWLNDYNPFFQNTFPILQITGTFLTFGFEKEGFSPDIAYFYKNPNTSDNQWFSLSQENQVSELKKLTAAKKSFLSAKYIAPTALKPEFLDGYSEELATSHNNNRKWGWEIRHKKYEINFERFFNQITEITQSFKETHSLHSHLVFELPINYKFFEQFQGWSKWVNDYLVLKGMEEGLHPNALTSIANRPQNSRYG